MSLMHWTSTPLASLIDKTGEQKTGRKPTGLWVSDESNGDGWSSWCDAEGMMDWLHPYAYDIALRDDANVLRIDSIHVLDRFHDEWKRENTYGSFDIAWPAVARAFDGILIAPYRWERRLDGPVSNWYYGWDCASGCIWHPRAISTVSEMAGTR